jgi:hypothetical protein
MATTRPFAYNTGSTITGTIQIGDLAVGYPLTGFTNNPQFWNGPDEDLGYVICRPNLNGDQPNPVGIPAYVRFLRSKLKTEESFVSLTNVVFNQTFTSGSECKSYLDTNGYWNSWVNPTPTPTPTNTPTNTPTPTPTNTPTPTPTNINAQGFSYSNFASTVGITAVGNASVISNIYYLTTAGNAQTGNVYRTTAIQYNRNFSTQWSTFIGGGTGADGYCIQWTPTNNTNGGGGGGVGYLSTAINAITFLTYINNNFTWYKNNVSQGATSVTSGFWRQTLYFWGDYNHSAQTFALYWNTTNSKPVSPNKTFTSFLFDTGSYYMGFGAATGGANDNHQLINWTLTFT